MFENSSQLKQNTLIFVVIIKVYFQVARLKILNPHIRNPKESHINEKTQSS